MLHFNEYVQQPWTSRFTTALTLLCYLWNDSAVGILFRVDSSITLHSFQQCKLGSLETHHSASIYFIKQAFPSVSSFKAEIWSMHRAVTEITWLLQLVQDMSITPSLPTLIVQAAFSYCSKFSIPQANWTCWLDCHFARQQFLSDLISLSLFLLYNNLQICSECPFLSQFTIQFSAN